MIVLAAVHGSAWRRVVATSYLLSPIPGENGSTLEDIIDKDACPEDGRNVPSDVVDDVLLFPRSLLLPLTLLRWFLINPGRLKRGLDYRLGSQFD